MSLGSTSWLPLPLTSPVRSAPPLLLKTHFTASSYTVHLTDLTRVWTESLSKPALLQRAAALHTSIDPSEGSDQLRILLSKLSASLASSSSSDNTSTVSLHAHRDGSLRLRTTHTLPGGLPPLKWTFHLALGSAVEFADVFVLPLMALLSVRTEQAESLVGIVRDKDRVIEKLSDSLEDSKVDVRTVLGPGKARRRGLEKFDEKVWREDIGDAGEVRPAQLVRDVFTEGYEEDAAPVRSLGKGVEDWWKVLAEEEEEEENVDVERIERPSPRVKQEADGGNGPVAKESKGKQKTTLKAASETEDSEDEFVAQRSRSPERRKTPITPRASSATKSISPARSAASSLPRQKPTPSKLGRAKDGPATPPPPDTAPVKAEQDENMGSTTEDSEEDAKVPAKAPTPPPPPPQKKIMSTIGGKKKVEAEEAARPPPPEEAPKPAPAKKVIGKIGGKKTAPVPAPKVEDVDMEDAPAEAVPRSPTPPLRKIRVPTPAPSPAPWLDSEAEDSDEAADRKRQELERKLAAQRAAPAKKKRRF